MLRVLLELPRPPKSPRIPPKSPPNPPQIPLRDPPQIPKSPPNPPKISPNAPKSPPNPPKSSPNLPKSPQTPQIPPKSPSGTPQHSWDPPNPPKSPQIPPNFPPELFLTEHAHVRMLRVLLELFYQPMLREGFFDEQELSNIFPSLEDLVEVHSESLEGILGVFGVFWGVLIDFFGSFFLPAAFLDSLKKLREESGFIIAEIGDVLLARFEGTEGSWFQKISARFCSRQSFALEQLKAKQRKDTRFSQFIQVPQTPQNGLKTPEITRKQPENTQKLPENTQKRPENIQNQPETPKTIPKIHRNTQKPP
uniref:DH domain-containing protein n=1 Tax=Taeniopygia guttata TaxID=59729 RepID=A0A674HJZ2_TAEGU